MEMDSFTPSYYDQDSYGVFIQELNDTLNTPRLNMEKHPALRVPMMFWTDHDCYLLMELARTSPEIVDNLPRLKVASDPASTDFFYERLRDIARNARMEYATGRGNYAVIRKIPEDISQKVPMPWHAPGWKNQSSLNDNGIMFGSHSHKISYWPSSQPNRLMQNTNTFLPSYAPSSQNIFALNETVGSTLPENKPVVPLTEEFFKFQDEFFMSRMKRDSDEWPDLASTLTSSSNSSNTSLKVDLDQNRGSIINNCGSAGGNQSERSSSPPLSSMWPSTQVEIADYVQASSSNSRSATSHGRYWPKQLHTKDCNSYEASQAPKMGQVYTNCVRTGKAGSGKGSNYHCKVHHDGSDGGNGPGGSKENYLCVFCKGNNEPEAIYKSHPLRLNNIVICPSLRNYTCCICKATGDNAHTIKYCPFNKRGFFATRSHEKCNSNNNSRIKMKVQIIEGTNGSSSPQSNSSDRASDLFHQRNFQPIPMLYDRNSSPDMEDEDSGATPPEDSGDEDYSRPSPMNLIISVEKSSSTCKHSRC